MSVSKLKESDYPPTKVRRHVYQVSWQDDPKLSWSRKGRTPHEAYCSYCSSYINVRDAGVKALLTHAALETHLFIMNCKIDGYQMSNKDNPSNSRGPPQSSLTKRAEIVWCLHAAAEGSTNLAFNSTGVFATMFADSKIAKDFVLSRSKMKHHINRGIKPYLLSQILKQIRKKGCLYVLDLVESSVGLGCRILELYLRFWNDKAGKIVNVLIECQPINKYDSDHALASCIEALRKTGVPLHQLVHISTPLQGGDTKVIQGVEKAVIEAGGNKFIETFPFNENDIYRAYEKTLLVVADWGLEDLVSDLVAWFDTCSTQPDMPFRKLFEVFAHDENHQNSIIWDDFSENSEATTAQSCASHCVPLFRHTLGLNRWFKIIVTNWTCLVRYFQNYVPSTERGVRKSPRFQRIHSTLSNPFTLLRLWFFRSIGNTLEDFIFNSIGTEGSSVHLIFKGSSSLIKDIGGRFLKRRPNVSAVSGVAHLKFEKREDQLDDDKIDIGDPPTTFFRDIPVLKLVVFYAEVRDVYAFLFGYLAQHLPLADTLIRGCKPLNPDKRTEKDYSKSIKELIKSVPQIIDDQTSRKILEEWNLYQASEVEGIQSYESVELYWQRVFQTRGTGVISKFGNLSKLVQVMLCLYYRPPLNERYLSISGVEERQACQVTRQYLTLLPAPAVKMIDIPITEDFLAAYQEATKKYSDHCELSDPSHMEESREVVVNLDGRGIIATSDAAECRYLEIREVEFLCAEGLKQVSEGIEDECQLEVNGGIALIEEAREQIRALQSKLAQREHIKQLDENNRLLVAGLYTIKQSQNSGKDYEARAGLGIIKWGLDGLTDLKLDMLPDFTVTQQPIESYEEEQAVNESECRGCFR